MFEGTYNGLSSFTSVAEWLTGSGMKIYSK